MIKRDACTVRIHLRRCDLGSAIFAGPYRVVAENVQEKDKMITHTVTSFDPEPLSHHPMTVSRFSSDV